MTRTRALVSALLLVYGGWLALVVSTYFLIPDELIVFDGPVGFPMLWQAATVDAARAAIGALTVLLAGRGVGAAIPTGVVPFERPLDRSLFLLAIGLSGVSLLSQAAAYLGVYTAPVVAAAVIMLAIAGAVAAGRDLTRLRLPPIRGADRLYVAVAAIALLTALIGALAPETEYDALWYHLWLPQQWLSAGRPVDFVEEYISLYPLSWDLSYGAALAITGAGAAKLLHFACLPLLAATTWRLARALAPGASASLAAALTVTTPTLIWEATTAYVDLALAWYLALVVLALVRYHQTQDRRWLMAGAVVLGGALAIKHLALVAMAIVGVVLVGRELARSRQLVPVFRTAVLFAVVALAVPAPWYARAFVQSGNPVFPDLYRVFGASPVERWDDLTERSLTSFKTRFGRERTPAHLATLPWDVTMHGARYGGTVGPLFLLLIPAAFLPGASIRYRWTLVLGWLAYVAVWASPISSFQLRFLVPLVPILAVLAAVGARRIVDLAGSLSAAGPRLAAAALTTLLALNLPFFTEAHDKDRHRGGLWLTHVMGPIPIGVVIGAESPERYLTRRVPSYAAWRFINGRLAEDARVLTFSGGDHLYSERRRLWSDAAAARPVTWGAAIGTEDTVYETLARMEISHVLLDQRQLTDGKTQELAIASDAMRACCLYPIYTDHRFALFELRDSRNETRRGRQE